MSAFAVGGSAVDGMVGKTAGPRLVGDRPRRQKEIYFGIHDLLDPSVRYLFPYHTRFSGPASSRL